ncbi:basic salivary proline-rich protein 2-like [Macrobrachium nipponense]|uniref:basic salivary proline-rich protein 2-like n=1 Tax=Macrobrachium nipponense TaxID=159736 RepID=UPI0030C819AE
MNNSLEGEGGEQQPHTPGGGPGHLPAGAPSLPPPATPTWLPPCWVLQPWLPDPVTSTLGGGASARAGARPGRDSAGGPTLGSLILLPSPLVSPPKGRLKWLPPCRGLHPWRPDPVVSPEEAPPLAA